MKSGFAAFFLILGLASCASVTQEDIKNANYHYQMGISYLSNNNIQPAFVELQKALELNPHDKNVHEMLGIIYLDKLENYPKAVEHFREALDIDENFSEAANNLGSAYLSMGKFDQAIASYKKAISNPQYKNAAMALYNLGMVYYRLSKFDEAMDAFKESLRRFSNFPMPYYGLALCYNAKGQYGDAAAAMGHAVEIDPIYKGDKKKAKADLKDRKISAKDDQEKDIADFLDILQY